MRPVIPLYVIVYAVVDDALSPDFPLGDSLEVFMICREDAERFIEDVRSDEPELASHPRRYLRLRWEDVDFDVAVVRVRRSLLEDGTPTKPKTAAGVRAVPMLPKLRRLLVAWKLRSPHARPTDLVVCTAKGGHVLKGNLRRSLEAAKTAAKVDGGEARLSWHSLRHSFASRLATDLELPATTLAEIIGHSDPASHSRSTRETAATRRP